ncbi:MAG: DNA-directed RNA polymerase subunit epsilon [Bombilactobacillus mellis]|uniref:DNA-directed RNA polymerase subunit epsilon n=1 Tax=Bombilactobacillus mellis TaxID=1218508 RepID=UPI0015811398|nr:DNA-directed RNA polymerase subunit epsilon [Bombilactobacillus mellis]MCT6857096.1 DNA-directed RNA polymerase subunit epsilon [Bombilactobacillus mellis]MCT6872617.1 DNA-directed RNA polymerase subunit epsilon [Bombilactobacillus mellis]MCX0278582.1 DNA-directed RNA polymerase subunit epsilon [Bombilactobacillus mellis]NUF98373.1 DNA-dependent RNA polymerase auxiliary subunit epsilon family protein [Bombilactobacillus mellis]
MIYKVLYQKDQIQNPRRETTETLYTQSDSAIKVREILEAKTDFNVESIEELSGNYLEYEQKSPNYKLTDLAEL